MKRAADLRADHPRLVHRDLDQMARSLMSMHWLLGACPLKREPDMIVGAIAYPSAHQRLVLSLNRKSRSTQVVSTTPFGTTTMRIEVGSLPASPDRNAALDVDTTRSRSPSTTLTLEPESDPGTSWRCARRAVA